MTKRFVVTLRKGSAQGPILAATNTITLSQGNGIVQAEDFVDGRMTGRVIIDDNTGEFSKISLPLPTTTTTTTTTVAPGPAPNLTASISPTSIVMDGISTTQLSWNASRSTEVRFIFANVNLLLGNTSNISSNITGNITFGPYTNSDRPGTITGNVIATGPNGTAWRRLTLSLTYAGEYIDISPAEVSSTSFANLTVAGIPNTAVTLTSNSYVLTTPTSVTLDSNGFYRTTLVDTNVGTWQYQAVFAATGAVRRKTYRVNYPYIFEGAVESGRVGSGGVAIGGGSGFITAGDLLIGGTFGTDVTPNTDIEYPAIIDEYVPVVDITTGEIVYVKVTTQDGSPYTSTTQELIVQKDDDGNTLYLLPDGTMILENPDGEVISTTIGGDPLALERPDDSDIDLLALRFNPDESPFGDDPKLQPDSIETGTIISGSGDSDTYDGLTGAGEFGSEPLLVVLDNDSFSDSVVLDNDSFSDATVSDSNFYIPNDTGIPGNGLGDPFVVGGGGIDKFTQVNAD